MPMRTRCSAQIDYAFTDHWKMTLGARYTEDNKDADEFRTRALYGFATRIPAGSPCCGLLDRPAVRVLQRDRPAAIHLSGDWHATTGTAGLEWTPTDDTLAFVKYTRGYKSGGFNAGAVRRSRGLHRSGVHQLLRARPEADDCASG